MKRDTKQFIILIKRTIQWSSIILMFMFVFTLLFEVKSNIMKLLFSLSILSQFANIIITVFLEYNANKFVGNFLKESNVKNRNILNFVYFTMVKQVIELTHLTIVTAIGYKILLYLNSIIGLLIVYLRNEAYLNKMFI